jgi:hypothetical protein
VSWWWMALTGAAFLVVTALVGVLARGSTARWERDRRASRAPQPAVPPPGQPGPATGVRGAIVRWTITAVHLPVPLPAPFRAAAGLLVSTGRQVLRRPHRLHRPHWPRRSRTP